MSSGGGGGGTQGIKTEWNDVIGSYYGGRPGPDGQGGGGVLGWAAAEANKPWQQYGQADRTRNMDFARARVAGLDPLQTEGMQAIRNAAYGSRGYGDDTTVMGQGHIQNVLSGSAAWNPYINDTNQYAGENPYFKDMVKNANEDTAKAYQQGTSAELTRLMNMSGAFGGSAHQNALANNQAGLAKQLGNQTTSMYGQQYDKSANLEENSLNRRSQLAEGALGRQMQAVPLAYQSQGLKFDAANQLMNAGALGRSYQQQLNDSAYGNWADSNNWSRNNIDWLLSKLGGAAGNTGTQTQFGGYQGPNYLSQAAGLGLLGKVGGLY